MRDHKSLLAWVEARTVTQAAFKLTRTHRTPHAAELFRQLQRAALSIQLNIAEGHALGDRGRFGNHLAVAYGSATETAELIELAVDDASLPKECGEQLLIHTQQCERLLLGLLKRYRDLPVR